jgi:hypothetical protein
MRRGSPPDPGCSSILPYGDAPHGTNALAADSAFMAMQEIFMAKRELIEPNGDKRYIRRDEKGRIKESDDVGRSLAQDVRRSAKTKVPAGQGDKGDQKRAT